MSVLSRQTIQLAQMAGINSIRLNISRRVGEQWVIHSTLTVKLDELSKLDIVYLGGGLDPSAKPLPPLLTGMTRTVTAEEKDRLMAGRRLPDPVLPVRTQPVEEKDRLTTQPQVTPVTKYVNATAGLHVRREPAVKMGNIITKLKHGTAVEILEPGEWAKVRVGDVTGYASSKYLSAETLFVDRPGEFRFEVWPTDSKVVTQHFGGTAFDYKKLTNGFLPAHEGIDLVAPIGAPYYCVAPGEVVWISDKRRSNKLKDSAYGWHIVVDHADGYSTLYAHAQEQFPVSVGDTVGAGDILAYSGRTGRASGPHLHLTLKKQGHQKPGWPRGYMDPWPFLKPLA